MTVQPATPPVAHPTDPLGIFAAGVMRAIGAPPTAANLNWFRAWAAKENTAAKNNPLATTRQTAASTPLPGNTAGVQQYPSALAGIQATAATLEGYPSIVAAFKTGDITATSFRNPPALVHAFTVWSGNTKHPDAGLAYYQAVKLGAQGNPAGHTAADIGSFDLSTALSAGKKAASAVGGGMWSGLTGWLQAKGKILLAYLLLGGAALALFVAGARGLGAPIPRIPRVVPV